MVRLAAKSAEALAGPKTVRQGPHVAVTSRVVLQPNPNFDASPSARAIKAPAPVSSPLKSPLKSPLSKVPSTRPYVMPPRHSAEAQQVQLLGEFTKTLQSILTKLQNTELPDSQREKYQAMADKIHNKIKTIKLAGSARVPVASWAEPAEPPSAQSCRLCQPSVRLIAAMQVHTFATFSNPAVRCQTPNVSLLQRLSLGAPGATSHRELSSTVFASRCQVKQKIHGFFFGSGTGSPVQDNLVEVVRRNPVAASSLLRTVSWFSAVGNLASATSCGVFLWLYWTSCATCDRPLRCWLLLQSFLQVLQLPVRLVLLHTMRHVEVSSGDFQEWITSLTSSQAWQMSKKVAVFQYGCSWWRSCPSQWHVPASPCASFAVSSPQRRPQTKLQLLLEPAMRRSKRCPPSTCS
eukprot:g11199.t1